MTLKWLFDMISKLNSVYGKLIYKTKYFKSFAIIYKLIIILGIITCILIKNWKISQLKNNEEEKCKEEDTDLENLDKKNDLIHLSEERWKK
jgi:hypothetical protein